MNPHFQKCVAWSGLARTWPWPSGVGGKASGAGQGSLETPGPWGLGTLGTPGPRHWLRLKRHLAMAWPGHCQAMARSWPGQTRQHIFGNDDELIINHKLIYFIAGLAINAPNMFGFGKCVFLCSVVP